MTRSYIPTLDTLRAVAALGILTTHVSFNTHVGVRVFERFDYFVAVFFALSGFLLWRRYTPGTRWGMYVVFRAARIVPAYWVTVLTGFILFTAHDGALTQRTLIAVVANLGFVQLFVPYGLLPGLTHLWTMSVEVAFYLTLPILRETLGSRRIRVPVLVLLAAASLGWAFLPIAANAGGVNGQLFPPAYASWYIIGILLAEMEHSVPIDALRSPLLWIPCILASTAALLIGTYAGPAGLTHPTASQFMVRVLFGGVFAAGILIPWVLCPFPVGAVGRWLGKISYSLFLWHVPVLFAVFTLTGIPLFSGHFVTVWVLTVILSVAVAYISYTYIESPFVRWKAHHRM